MKIIRPCHHKVAEKVKSWLSIKKEALELREFIKHTKENVEGYYKTAYAISHVQVSENPKNFFVLGEALRDDGLVSVYGHWCIINLEIVAEEEPVWFTEACMSFPFRKEKPVARMKKVTVKYRVPFLWFTRPVTRKLAGLCAYIAQHESDHANGINIYGK